MAFCDNCGHDNKKNVKFCSSCGTKIEISAPMVEKKSSSKILDVGKGTLDDIAERNKPRDPNKMRWGVAIGGAILLAFGLVLVVSGAATGFAAMCWGPPTSVRCHSDGLMMMMGWAIFWIGLIPTIFGIRYVAKA